METVISSVVAKLYVYRWLFSQNIEATEMQLSDCLKGKRVETGKNGTANDMLFSTNA